MSDQSTWRIKHGLAMWIYSLSGSPDVAERASLTDPEFRHEWFSKRLEKAIDLLDDFARPGEVSVFTLSHGEDSFVSELANEGSLKKLLDYLQQTNDVELVDICLTLCAVDIDENGTLKEEDIKFGGYLRLYVELDEKGELDATIDDPIWLTLSLNVDIYSPVTWGEIRNNRELAAHNGPRLSAFLKRLEHELPAVFVEVDADDYEEVAGRYGFIGTPESDQV